MTSLITKLTSPSCLRTVGACGCLGTLLGGILFYAQARRLVVADGVVLGRDFLAFYLAGRIVADGNGDRLYDGAQQQAVQDVILAPESLEGLAYYINPAPVAVAYSVLARLPYRAALHVHTALMLVAYAAAMWLLGRNLSALQPHWMIAAAVGLVWMPLVQTISGGQNAALTLLLCVVAFSATVRGRQPLAGVALGLLLFKPQYALPFIGLLLLRRRWLTVSVALLVGVGLYTLGGAFCGWDWPLKMAASLGGLYHQQERVVSGHTHISILEALDYALGWPLEQAGWDKLATAVKVAGWGSVAAVVVLLMWRWRDADPTRADFGLYWAMVGAAMLLISPHTQYYEAALLLLPVLLILDFQVATQRPITGAQRCGLLAAFCLYPLVGAARILGFQPLILLPAWIAWWSARLMRGNRAAAATR